MRKAVVVLLALLVIVNIPIMLRSEATTYTSPDDIPAVIYEDFETTLADWTVTGQAWISTNMSTHGTHSALIYNGGINRTFGVGNNTNVTVEIKILDPDSHASTSWGALYVYNATATVAVGCISTIGWNNYHAISSEWGWASNADRVPALRTSGWHTWQMYLHDGKAGMQIDGQWVHTLNITNPIGYGFNVSARSGNPPIQLYIDEFLVYKMWQSDIYTPISANPIANGGGSYDYYTAGVFYNASTGDYDMYVGANGPASNYLYLVKSLDGTTWNWAGKTTIENSVFHRTTCVIQNGGHWYRFYWDNQAATHIKMANSSDGITFTDDRMIIADAFQGSVWIDSGGTWYILYQISSLSDNQLALATSPTGYTWTPNPTYPVFNWRDLAVDSYLIPAGYPSVTTVGSTFYMALTYTVFGATTDGVRLYKSTNAIDWTNCTTRSINVPDEWRLNRQSNGVRLEARILNQPYFFDGPAGHFMIYSGGASSWLGANFLLQAQSPHSFAQVAEGEVWQYGYVPFENCSNNATSSGQYWHYGVNEFVGSVNHNISIIPAVGPVNVSITQYTPSVSKPGENAISFTANQTPAGAVQFMVRLAPYISYTVFRDGSEYARFTTNGTGWHAYIYSGAWSLHYFSFSVALSGVSGIDWTFPATTGDTTLRRADLVYPPNPPTVWPYMWIVPSTNYQEMQVGQYLGLWYPDDVYEQFRNYLSFNTSALPNAATVLSAELRVMLRTAKTWASPDFNVLVYGSNFTNLDIGDWNKSEEYQGVLMSASVGIANTWYSMPISTDQINLTGSSQFMMRSSREGIAPGLDETIRFWNTTSAYYPVLVVKIQVLGTVLALERDDGTWYNSSIFPEVQNWNMTYDLLYFSFSTIPATRNATIFKQSSTWIAQGFAPACNYTETSTEVRLEDLFDSIDYRVWLTAPKAYAYSLCHIALYNSFTGEGLFWEQMRVIVSDGDTYDPSTAHTVSNPDMMLNSQQNYTFTVADYFGNLVTNYSVYTSASQLNIYIPVPIYSYKFYNQNPTFALLRVHYNLTGTPYSEFIPPYDSVNRYLKTGTYRFNITFYNATGYAGNTYTWVRTIPSSTFPGAGFVILEGDTISEAIAAANGVKAVVLVIADLVTPDLIWVGMNLPQVPAYLMTVPNTVVFNNRYLVDSDITQTRTGSLLNFSTPIPGNVTVSTLIADDFRFVGNLTTQIYVNTTAATVYSNSNLPAGISLSGGTYTIWTNRTISALRDTHFRWQRTFTYQYFPATDVYQAQITFQNDVGIQWRNLTLFIPFQNNSRVDNRSVQVYDMNNTVPLAEGVNYVLSKTGVHMWFAAWNASLWRGFRITYTTVNESVPVDPAVVVVNQLGDGTLVTMSWQSDSYYFCVASWTNAYREDYDGPLYITLELTVGIDPTSIIVIGESGIVVTSAVVFGNTISIPSIHLDVGEKVTYTVLFKSPRVSSPMDLTFAGIPVMFVAIAIMIAAFVVGLTFYVFQKDERIKQFGRMMIGVAVLAMGFIAIVLIYFIVAS